MRTEALKEAQRRYRQSEKGRQAQKRYRQSEKGKIAHAEASKRYYQSEKGKVAHAATSKRYQQSEKGKMAQAEANKRYNDSLKGQEARKRYQQSDKGRIAQRLAMLHYHHKSRPVTKGAKRFAELIKRGAKIVEEDESKTIYCCPGIFTEDAGVKFAGHYLEFADIPGKMFKWGECDCVLI